MIKVQNRNTPDWAVALCEKYLGEKPVILVWRNSNRRINSSGRAVTNLWKPIPNKLVITAGSVVKDQKVVLLHEIAHLLTGWKDGIHSEAFWEKAFELYHAEMPEDMDYIKKREFRYKATAKVVYQRLYE